MIILIIQLKLKKYTEEVDDVIEFFKLLTASAVDLACNHLDEDSVRCERLTVTSKTKDINKRY